MTWGSEILCITIPTFADAAREAKELAQRFGESVGVGRDGDGWTLVVSDRVERDLKEHDRREYESYRRELEAEEHADEHFEEEIQAERQAWDADNEIEELHHELESDADDYARSEEEGWFYDDND